MRKTPVLLIALAVAGGVASAIPASAVTDGSATVPQSHPQWATPQSKVADAPTASSVSFEVYLQNRDQAAAEALAQAVSDPSSKSYHQYLTPDQVRAQFAPTRSTVDAVRAWLSSAGFKLGAVPANNAYVPATGTVDQVNKAFSVHLGEYSVSGKQLRSTDSALSVPTALASQVLGVSGVNQSPSKMTPMHTTGADNGTAGAKFAPNAKSASTPGAVAPPAGFRNSQPCGAYYGQKVDTTDPAYNGQQLPYAPCGYTPEQVRSADGISPAVAHGVDGRGVTVAIVDAFGSPTLQADATEYAKRNDPAHPLRASQYRQIVATPTPGSEDPSQCDAAGWYGEQSLDVEAVHAMAPGAKILYVGGADCQDTSLDDAVNSIVATHSADLISNSYGDLGEGVPAADVTEFNQIAVQAVLEGIGLYFSSGDAGDEVANVGRPEADFSASDPWVTAVGGTSVGIGKNGNKVVETGWETSRSRLTSGAWTPAAYQYGAGGGTSRLFSEPFYQRGIVPNALAAENQTGNSKGRVVPDVSELADPNTGFLIGLTQTFSDGVYYDQYRIGGTSLASPLMAGFMADSDQLTGFHHGFINPLLYRFTSRTPAITDVQHAGGGVVRVDFANSENASGGLLTSVRTFDYQQLTIQTAKGYDNVTGVGTPNGWLFLALS